MKVSTMLMLSLAVLVLVAGCTSAEAQQQQYDYIPMAGQGCGFAPADVSEDTKDFLVEEEVVFKTNFF